MQSIDGFWLPHSLRQRVLAARTEFTHLSFAHGQPSEPGAGDAVTVRWPVLAPEQWQQVLVGLQANRRQAPQGDAFWKRLQTALAVVGRRLANPADPAHALALATLPGHTGYSEAMIRFTLGALDMWTLEQLAAAFRLAPVAAAGWQPMGDLQGRIAFFGTRRHRWWGRLAGRGDHPLFGSQSLPELVVGYGAGNVPGTALIIAFLALAATLAGGPPPAVVIKNSRRESIFAPLVLSLLEAADPDLTATLAVLIWDYDDPAQAQLLGQADLVIAAASDETIARIGREIASFGRRQTAGRGPIRYHAHGHKASFSAIGREVLPRGLGLQPGGPDLIDAVALLAALDSIFWDQHGCLSSRVHFVETGGEGHYTPLDYAMRLAGQLGLLASFLPRGAWPRQRLHDRFDRYKLLEQAGQVCVLSRYDDDFVVFLDTRPLDAASFQAVVNDCEGRVIAVRPVKDLMEVPELYLPWIPAANLQSLSVAVGQPGEGLSDRFLRFAEACGARGVTAIRTVGRGAFPQLAYSWDGLIPVDLVGRRPAGHFTTIEFDAPYDELVTTYRLMLQRGAAGGSLDR